MLAELIKAKLTSRSLWIDLPFETLTKKNSQPTGYAVYQLLIEIDLLENRLRITILGNSAYVVWYHDTVLFPLLQKKEGD